MKITIDTDSKEITIHGEIEFHELVKFYENFPESVLGKVGDYRIRQEMEIIKEFHNKFENMESGYESDIVNDNFGDILSK